MENITEIMEMRRQISSAITQNSRKKERKSHGSFGSVTLLLAISLFMGGCDNANALNELATEEASGLLTSETIEGEQSSETEESGPIKIDTVGGVVEIVTVESAKPEDYLDPDEYVTEGQYYDWESLQKETEGSDEQPSSEETASSETASSETPSSETEESSSESSSEAETTESKQEEEKKETKKTSEIDPFEKVVDFETLQKKNADVYAWLYVPGTNIDYPVLQHPTDNGFYLHHNLDGSAGYPGCIYSEKYNSKDWDDPVTVLYGHNMISTGKMFFQLHKFEKKSFFDTHQYFYIYTPEKTMQYEIFSDYVHSNEHLLYNHNFYNKEVFDSFFSTVLATNNTVSHVREGVAISSDSKIVCLSTCIKGQSNTRFLVFGVLVE